jgi:hypothetical protein
MREPDTKPGRTGRLVQLWRHYNLSIVVATLFVVASVLEIVFGWWEYVAEQTAQGQTPTVFGDSGYVVYLGEWTFQNWQSEFMIVFVVIVLTVSLIHKGSHESKDGEDEMRATITRIEQRLDAVEQSRRKRRSTSPPQQ